MFLQGHNTLLQKYTLEFSVSVLKAENVPLSPLSPLLVQLCRHHRVFRGSSPRRQEAKLLPQTGRNLNDRCRTWVWVHLTLFSLVAFCITHSLVCIYFTVKLYHYGFFQKRFFIMLKRKITIYLLLIRNINLPDQLSMMNYF